MPLLNCDTTSARCGTKSSKKRGMTDLEVLPLKFLQGSAVSSSLYIGAPMLSRANSLLPLIPSVIPMPFFVGHHCIRRATSPIITQTRPHKVLISPLPPSPEFDAILNLPSGHLLCNVPTHHSGSVTHTPSPTFLPSLCSPDLFIYLDLHLALL